MTTTPQSQARSWLRWIARHWSADRIADLPVYDDEPYSLGGDAYYHYRGLHETTCTCRSISMWMMAWRR